MSKSWTLPVISLPITEKGLLGPLAEVLAFSSFTRPSTYEVTAGLIYQSPAEYVNRLPFWCQFDLTKRAKMALIGDSIPRFTVSMICPPFMFGGRKGSRVEKSRVNADLGF